MKSKKNIFVIFLILFFLSSIQAQTHNSVSVDENVYRLLDIAEMKGLLHNLSQVRPYSSSQVLSYLHEMERQSSKLTEHEKTVLKSTLNKYLPPERNNTPANIAKEGKVFFNNEKEDLFPISSGFSFDFEERADLNSGTIHSTNYTTFTIEGDISSYSSFNIDFSLGIANVNTDAFSPYSYTDTVSDGYYIAFSGGLDGGGLVDGDEDGASISMMSNPELQFSLLDDDLQFGIARVRRDLGNGYGNLSVSGSARPYTGMDLKVRPIDWFSMYYSVGSLSNWFDARDEGGANVIDQKMLTTQVFEFMPAKWLYTSLSTSVIWGKRFEMAYMIPVLPPIIGQSLAGDQDNAAVDFSIALKLPIGLKIYGGMFFDEMRSTDGITDPVMPYASQAGIKWVVPKLPFTTLSFQYTKIEPYCYAHDDQEYYFADDDDVFDTSWTNDSENLGYYLPPNSDEFLIRLETLPYDNFRFLLKYQYIRHGDGDPDLGEMEGSTSSGSFDASTGNTKDFLNDGIYEKIHIFTIEAEYEFEELPFNVSLDYSFNYAENFENISGNTVMKNIVGLKLHIYP